MKPRKRVKKKRGKIARLKASADAGNRARDPLGELAKFYRPVKQPVTLRLDADVVAWFKKHGRGYQTRINRALRELMMERWKGSRG
ncbi:MAG: BrnA antitoxin family protein [Terriglobales bacterium]